jgi:hypothetical protein
VRGGELGGAGLKGLEEGFCEGEFRHCCALIFQSF